MWGPRMFIALVALAALSANAQISSTFATKAAVENAKALLQKPTSLKAAFYSTKILDALKTKDYSCGCKALQSLLAKETDVYEIFHGLTAAKACKCADVKTSDKQNSEIKKALKSQELTSLAGAALASKALGTAVTEGETAIQHIIDLRMPDGTYRSSADSSEKGSLHSAKAALRALNAYADSSKVSSAIGKALDGSVQLLPSGDADSVTAADPTLLAFLKGRDAVDKSIRTKWKQLVAITQSLLALQYAGPEDGYETLAMAIEALQVVVSLKASPVVVTLGPLTSSSKISLKVTDAFGASVTPSALDCKSVKKVGRDNSLFSGSCLGGLDLSSQRDQLTAGRFVVELSVQIAEDSKAVPLTRFFLVSREIDVVNVHAGVTDTKSASSNDLSEVKKQNKWSGGSAKSDSGDHIHLNFALQQAAGSEKRFQKPHQCFVRFTHVSSGTSAFFVAQGDGALSDSSSVIGLKYKTSVVLSKEIETFSHLSGEYLVSILVSDLSAEGSEFVVGSLDITVPPKVEKIYPLYQTSLLHTSDNTLAALPEIEHKMRPPAKRASIFMSTVFTVLTLLPLLGFISFALSLRPNLQRFGAPSSYLFVASIGGSLVLYLAYWAGLPGASFYDTIKYICVIVVATAVIGRSAVSDMAK